MSMRLCVFVCVHCLLGVSERSALDQGTWMLRFVISDGWAFIDPTSVVLNCWLFSAAAVSTPPGYINMRLRDRGPTASFGVRSYPNSHIQGLDMLSAGWMANTCSKITALVHTSLLDRQDTKRLVNLVFVARVCCLCGSCLLYVWLVPVVSVARTCCLCASCLSSL